MLPNRSPIKLDIKSKKRVLSEWDSNWGSDYDKLTESDICSNTSKQSKRPNLIEIRVFDGKLNETKAEAI